MMISLFLYSTNSDSATFIHCDEVVLSDWNGYIEVKKALEIPKQSDLYSIDYVEVTKGIDVGLILKEGVTLSLTSFTPIKKTSNIAAEF